MKLEGTELLSDLRCPSCGSELEVSTNGVACPGCGRTAKQAGRYLDFVASAEDPMFQEAEVEYVPDATIATPTVVAYWHRLVRHQSQVVRRLLGPGIRHVSVGGGGQNWYADDLGSFVSERFVVDPSPAQLDSYDERHATALRLRAFGEELPLSDAWADLVELQGVLDHLVDPERALREAHRVLRDGGVLTVVLSNDDSWFRRLAARLGIEHHDHAHARKYGIENVRRLVAAHGFDVVHSETLGYLRLPRRLDRALGWAGESLMQSAVGKLDRVLRWILGRDRGGITFVAGRRS